MLKHIMKHVIFLKQYVTKYIFQTIKKMTYSDMISNDTNKAR